MLVRHVVATAFERGWGALTNGNLIAAAIAAGFEALVTTDQNMQHQQDLRGRPIRVIVLPTTKWSVIRRNADAVATALDAAQPGAFVQLAFDA
jgi:hypothetical protein